MQFNAMHAIQNAMQFNAMQSGSAAQAVRPLQYIYIYITPGAKPQSDFFPFPMFVVYCSFGLLANWSVGLFGQFGLMVYWLIDLFGLLVYWPLGLCTY